MTIVQLISILAPLDTSDEHVLNLALSSFYNRVGSQNTLDLQINNLDYNYNDGVAPKANLKGSFGIDFTVFVSPSNINYFAKNFIVVVESIMRDYEHEFRDAFSFSASVTSTTKDASNNYTGLTSLISAKIDVTKLPEWVSSEDVIVTDAVLSLNLNAKTGISFDGFVVLNPAYKAYQEGEDGLKEFFEKLLENDQQIIATINDFLEDFDEVCKKNSRDTTIQSP